MQRIAFIGATGGAGTTTVALYTALTMLKCEKRDVTIWSHDRQDLLALMGMLTTRGDAHAFVKDNDGHERTLTVAGRYEDLQADVLDLGTLRTMDTPVTNECKQVLVVRGPSYQSLRKVSTDIEWAAGYVLVVEPGRSIEVRDAEQIVPSTMLCTIREDTRVAQTGDAGLWMRMPDPIVKPIKQMLATLFAETLDASI